MNALRTIRALGLALAELRGITRQQAAIELIIGAVTIPLWVVIFGCVFIIGGK